ncbi:hypothetical protein ACJX0J_013492 [Zea mays]
MISSAETPHEQLFEAHKENNKSRLLAAMSQNFNTKLLPFSAEGVSGQNRGVEIIIGKKKGEMEKLKLPHFLYGHAIFGDHPFVLKELTFMPVAMFTHLKQERVHTSSNIAHIPLKQRPLHLRNLHQFLGQPITTEQKKNKQPSEQPMLFKIFTLPD